MYARHLMVAEKSGQASLEVAKGLEIPDFLVTQGEL
jgi:hypothetical protein